MITFSSLSSRPLFSNTATDFTMPPMPSRLLSRPSADPAASHRDGGDLQFKPAPCWAAQLLPPSAKGLVDTSVVPMATVFVRAHCCLRLEHYDLVGRSPVEFQSCADWRLVRSRARDRARRLVGLEMGQRTLAKGSYSDDYNPRWPVSSSALW